MLAIQSGARQLGIAWYRYAQSDCLLSNPEQKGLLIMNNGNYFVRPIQNVDGTQMVAVVFSGQYERAQATMIKLTGNCEVLTGQISQQNTAAILGPIVAFEKYQIDITEDEAIYKAEFLMGTDGCLMDFRTINETDICADIIATVSHASTAATVTYTVHKPATSTVPIGGKTYTSLFEAINACRIAGTGAVVKMNGSTEVFCYGQSNRYYTYQFTASYGYVTTVAAAQQWLSNYVYSYVIQSWDARIYGANYKTLKGTAPSWALEPNSGGYYYQYSQYQNGYKKVSMTAGMSQAKLRLSDNSNQPFVAYVFINVHDANKFYDLGLVFNNDNHCWNTVCNPETGVTYSGDRTICSASFSNGEWIADGPVDIVVEMTTTGIQATLTNKVTNKKGIITVKDTGFCSTTPNLVLVPAVSYVPLISKFETPDFRCGGYFTNVQLTNCLIYNAAGTAYSFYATSNATNMSLVYNTDCCNVSATTAKTTVNIAYNRAYTT